MLKKILGRNKEKLSGPYLCYEYPASEYSLETLDCAIFHAIRLSEYQDDPRQEAMGNQVGLLKKIRENPTNQKVLRGLVDARLAGLDQVEYFSTMNPDSILSPLDLRKIINGVAHLDDLLNRNGNLRPISNEAILTHLALTYFLQQSSNIPGNQLDPEIIKDIKFAKEALPIISKIVTSIVILHKADSK